MAEKGRSIRGRGICADISATRRLIGIEIVMDMDQGDRIAYRPDGFPAKDQPKKKGALALRLPLSVASTLRHHSPRD